jgi:hypothetical protein
MEWVTQVAWPILHWGVFAFGAVVLVIGTLALVLDGWQR